jgi:hypothetical protein
VEFRYWIDGDIAKRGLSERWLAQTQVVARMQSFYEK